MPGAGSEMETWEPGDKGSLNGTSCVQQRPRVVTSVMAPSGSVPEVRNRLTPWDKESLQVSLFAPGEGHFEWEILGSLKIKVLNGKIKVLQLYW